MRRALFTVLCVASTACRGASTEEPAVRPDVELVGYRLLAREEGGAVAWFDPARMPSLFVRGELPSDAELELSIGASTERLAFVAPPEGSLFKVFSTRFKGREPAPGKGTLRLVSASRPIKWSAGVRFSADPEAAPEVKRLATSRKERALHAFLEEAEPVLAAAAKERRVWLLVELARAHQSAGDALGAAKVWEQRAQLAEETGLGTEVSRSLRAASFQRIFSGELIASRALLERARVIDEGFAHLEGLTGIAERLGWIALELGDFRRSEAELERAIAFAEQSGNVAQLYSAKTQLAVAWQAQGQHRAALSGLFELERWFMSDRATPIDRAVFLSSSGWMQLLAILEGESELALEEPRRRFAEAAQIQQREGRPEYEANELVNLAYTELAAGRPKECRELLMRARELSPGVRSFAERFLELLEAEAVLQEGEGGAARSKFRQVVARARRDGGEGNTELVIRAFDGEGRAALAAGDRRGALAAWREALQVADRLAQRTRLREHRAPFLAGRRALEERTLKLAIEDGENEAAFVVADAIEARVLQALETSNQLDFLSAEQRATWDQLGERYLARREKLEAGTDREWLLEGTEREAYLRARDRQAKEVALAFDEAYAHLERALPPQVKSVASLEALQAALRPKEALLLASGDHLFFVDEHGLELTRGDARAILATKGAIGHLYVVPGTSTSAWAVGPALDGGGSVSLLPYAGWLLSADPARAASSRALLVLDPTGDLPWARVEGNHVRARFAGATVLEGANATRKRVLDALADAGIFHFAGHGAIDLQNPWDAHLLLAGRERITVSDVFLRRAAPALAVLSGCETGLSHTLAGREHVSIADAFLIAGARSVLATTEPLSDERAVRFIENFYRLGGDRTPGPALAAAVSQAIEEQNPVWSAFRLLGRP
jgi:tetratricopeptide (TPR) repeat protein